MKKIGAFILVALLATPALMSAQSMGHQHQEGQQQMQQMGEGSAMHEDPAMHQDMEQLQGHMQNMTGGMEASIEVMQRLHKRMGGGNG